MDENQRNKRFLREYIRNEAQKGTSPEKALELVRAMVAQNPSLLGANDVKRPVGTGGDSLPTDSVQIDLKEASMVETPES